MHVLARDIRFALRRLRAAPGFALIVVLTLALGIGATTGIFSLIEGVLLRPLPFSNPDRLVSVGDHVGNNPGIGVTAREIDTYSNGTKSLVALGGYTTTDFELSSGATPEVVHAARLTAGVFTTLGVQPIAGRVFIPQEEAARQPLAVISYSLWQNRYHHQPQLVGTSISLDRKSYTIIGVMPRSFEFPLEAGRLVHAQVWVPMSLTREELSEENAGAWKYKMVGRLNDRVTLTQGAQDADRVARQIMHDFPPNMSAIHIRGDVAPLAEASVAAIRPVLRTLFLAVFTVLAIACVNVASLLMVRAIRRRREYALRLALGAPRSVILRESAWEGLLLSLTGGLLGLGFAALAIRIALHVLPESMPRVSAISVDAPVAAFALSLAVLTGIACSLVPAFISIGTNLSESLKEGCRTGGGAFSHSRMRSALIVAEIAIALVLLTACGAFLRSFQKMRAVNLGFLPENVLVANLQLPLGQYPTHALLDTFNHSLVDKLSNDPGIAASGITNTLPASGFWAAAAYTIEGVPTAMWKLKFASFATTYGDYFIAMGIPLLHGRTFTGNDRAGSPPVIIVNQSMANHLWPGQDVLGRRMHVGNRRKRTPGPRLSPSPRT